MAIRLNINRQFGVARASSPRLSRVRTLLIRLLRYIRNLWTLPGIPALGFSALIFLVFYLYGCIRFRRDPGSHFFNPNRAFDRHYSAFRERESGSWRNWAESMIDAVGDSDRHRWEREHALVKVGEEPSMCASFISVYRDDPTQFLENSIASALAKLSRPERSDLDIRIYVAHADPSIHPAWSPSSWVNYTVDEVYSGVNANTDPEVLKALKYLEEWESWSAKAILDYTVALERCLQNSTAPYIAVFDGDIILADSWFARTLVGLREVEYQMKRLGRTGRWLYLRLFNQERFTGWMSRAIWGNNVPTISAAISVIVCVALLKLRRRVAADPSILAGHATLARHLNLPTIFVICTFTVPAFTILFFQAGKASLLPPTPGVHRQDYGCCAQALVFNREHVPGLIEFLRAFDFDHESVWGHDVATHEFAKKNSLQKWSQYPVVAQHVGMTSQLNPHRMPWEQPTWSMEFESLSRRRLDLEHRNFVEILYGHDIANRYRDPVFGLKGLANS